VFSLCIPDAHPNLVLSGGKDAAIAIHLFDSTDDDGGLTTVSVIDTMKLMLPQRMIPERRSIRALACWNAEPGWLRLAFGTSANDVLQVEIDVRNLHGISLLRHTLCTVVHGHAGSAVKALCAHPDFPEFATAGQEGMLRLWNATHHSLSACVTLGHAGSAIYYKLASHLHLAVRLAEGGVIILNASAVRQGLQRDACFVLKVTDRRCEITDVKYSPDGHYLAVASVDNVIDIYVVKTSYTRWGVCRGHRDTIRYLSPHFVAISVCLSISLYFVTRSF
jgi:WD40 repeat protein